ncbi:MAG: AAA family ATPase [Clostridia bacterium]|nr:AAA family ATPase [Clostridia bacterium]
MNIKQAKEQIKQAVDAYRVKNEFGEPVIPVERQRPIFLMGAPGIGKTAIMEQIAQELGIGLVSYSMTHHTRQSALGLPFIVHKTYRGREYDVSEYTMSEIIASVYDRIEQDGAEEGILFLDEINCVSETLAPSMLQFLQYKTFGRHSVPEGWTVVTAGNPPEYNDSVREFDIVTWDRLKRIDVEPDFDAWKEYAISHGVHRAVLTYLEIKRSDFYQVETTVDGKRFVTARGWVDLSDMMKLYEQRGYAVNEQLIRQYLQSPTVAKSFAVYYDLFRKYRSDYQVDDILSGTARKSIEDRAAKAKFDERLSLLGLLLDAVNGYFQAVSQTEAMMKTLMNDIRAMRVQLSRVDAGGAAELLQKRAGQLESAAQAGRRANSMSEDDARADRSAARVMTEMAAGVRASDVETGAAAIQVIKRRFDDENARLKKAASATRERLDNMFAFCEKVFPEGQELLILVTELTLNPAAARFIGKYGCDAYFRNNKNLLFYERQTEIIRSIDELNLDE